MCMRRAGLYMFVLGTLLVGFSSMFEAYNMLFLIGLGLLIGSIVVKYL